MVHCLIEISVSSAVFKGQSWTEGGQTLGVKCQSCGMPLNRDPHGGCSEADGTRSVTYCSLCYENGAFRHIGFSATEMQDYCLEQLSNKGMPRFMARLFTRVIPKLDRWNH